MKYVFPRSTPSRRNVLQNRFPAHEGILLKESVYNRVDKERGLANKRNNIDREIDLHGFTASEARSKLNSLWATREWQGLQRVRVIHGTGSVLHALVKLWCEEKGVAWTVEPNNPGVTIIYPGRQLQSDPAPPHRPLKSLQPLKKRAQLSDSTKKQSTENSRIEEEENGLSDSERMSQEFERLGVTRFGSILGQKNSDDAGIEVSTPLQLRVPDQLAVEAEQTRPGQKSDPMEEEFARLGGDDALTLFKMKRELLPPRQAPGGAEEIANRGAGVRRVPGAKRLDPMAQEFERLGLESPQITRKKKGGRDGNENM
jgi:hypothetical protein